MFGFEGAANVLDFPKSPVKSSRSPAKRVREEEETQRNERVLVRAKTRDMELALTTWPVGQVVKTAASHAVNIGSNPVRVTKVFLDKARGKGYNAECSPAGPEDIVGVD